MAIQRHDIGPRMSKVVVHGNTVYLAGIVADNTKSKTVTEQTKDILKQVDGFLAKADTDRQSCRRPTSGSPTWPISPT